MNTISPASLRSLRLLCALACAATFLRAADAVPAAPSLAPGQAPGLPGGGRGAGVGGGQRGGARGGRGGGAFSIGPAAPVPPEVAISRPTTEEITQAEVTLNRLAASDAATEQLVEKYPGVSFTVKQRVNTAATYTQTALRNARGGNRHYTFVARANQGDIDLLFHGDSITDWWQTASPQGGRAVFDKYFGGLKTANFAIAGDTTQGLLWGLQNGEGQGFSPKAIMLMIGTNNTGGNTGPEIAEGVGAVVAEMRKDFPNAKILLLAIFPRGPGPNDTARRKNDEANKIIAKLNDNEHIFYLDIGAKFLDPATGAFLPGIFRTDNLHPVEAGYEIWAQAVKDKLAELMK
ncbi:MAG: GDSL-type esterase/lipase family protein [Verrucomicrobiota bacterium]